MMSKDIGLWMLILGVIFGSCYAFIGIIVAFIKSTVADEIQKLPTLDTLLSQLENEPETQKLFKDAAFWAAFTPQHKSMLQALCGAELIALLTENENIRARIVYIMREEWKRPPSCRCTLGRFGVRVVHESCRVHRENPFGLSEAARDNIAKALGKHLDPNNTWGKR
jgi:hypothetical protein